jgi:uncharacterized protein YbaR (Trm112 family)
MEQGGCLYREPSPCVQEEEVWETASDDSDASEADASEAEDQSSFIARLAAEIKNEQNAALEEGARRLLDMDFGDMSDDESEFSPFEDVASIQKPDEPKVDVSKPLVEPLFALPCGFQFSECAICYEAIEMVNVTVTTCGHTFHSSCAFKALEHADCCPMCRHQLIEVQEDEDEDEEDEDNEEDEEGEDQEDDQEEEEEDTRPTMEQLATKLQNMGYTPVDFLSLFMGDILKRQDPTRQSEEFLEALNEKIDDIVDGRITMAHVDQRSYAQVVAAAQPQPLQQQVVRLKDLERIIRQQPQQEEQQAV